ncbi:phage tail tip lysozyme [Oceaniglobus trochenteri]|uniref:phage tail tip lysozyme n=1 Tax=Oceaniglobus trochenteri TaxID=2763260 RepID=UPI001CFF742B|nr:phage tail tip lysozyme [Oceaniglobus trochenteri]
MSDKTFNIDMVFRANAAQVRAAANEAKREIENVTGTTMASTGATESHTASVKKDAVASREAAIAARQRAAAEAAAAKTAAASEAQLGRTGRAMKLNAHQAQNLTYQLNDVFQSFALGMPASQVLLQQGPQITQIYGGLGNTFRALKSVLTPVRVGIGLVASAAVLGASAYNGYLQSTKAVETAAKGLGRATAGSAADMEAAARAGAAAAGISIRSAREMQAGFLRTGRIGSEHFDELIGLSKDFAVTMGIDAAEAGGALAEMFADPAKAADVLYQKYGLIDGATARQARNLAAQNRESEAQKVLLEALPSRLADASEGVTGLARVWQGVATATSNVLDNTGRIVDRIIDGASLEEQIERKKAELQAKRNGQRVLGLSPEYLAEREAEIAELERFARRQEQIEFDQALRKRAERQGVVAIGLADKSGANENALREEKLRNEIKALEAGRGAPGLDEEQRSRIDTAIEAKSNALQGLIQRQEIQQRLDRLDIQIQNERNPLLRAELEARRARLQLAGEEISQEKIATEAERARQRSLEGSLASAAAQARGLRDEAEVRKRLAGQVAAGTITRDEANQVLQEELTLRPLVLAAALAEGDEKQRLNRIIKDLRDGYAALNEIEREGVGRDILRDQERKLDRLRLEASLLGATAEQRARILALHEAQQTIEENGLTGQTADAIRAQAVEGSKLTRELERQISAWEKVQNAGESAIDGIVESLRKGDFTGALDAIADEITGMFAELAISNPLKNAILGTDHATLDDVGGLKGIWDRLTGQAKADASILSTKSMDVAAMTVSAGTVIVNGTAGLPASAAANVNGAALGYDKITTTPISGNLKGSPAVQSQVWEFFAAKGLKPHQIAGIMGNASAESAFDPTAVGDGGNAFGLFQWNDRRHKLFDHIGGKGNLGDVNAQLEFAWKELQTSENRALQNLLKSTDVRGATEAFAGFERPSGFSWQNPSGAMHFDRRLEAAQQSLQKFGTTTSAATQNLGTLGNGFDVFGSALSSIQSGGGIGGFASNLFGGLVSSWATGIGLPGFNAPAANAPAAPAAGFASGGPTGGSDPSRVAGVVHEQEYVFDAKATARIGVANLDAMRRGALKGYRAGGYVANVMPFPTGPGNQVMGQAAPTVVNVNNFTGQPVEQEETTDTQGGRQVTMTIGAQGAAAIAQPGNPMPRQMEKQYRLRRPGIAR